MSTELSTPWIVTLASTIVAVLASVVAFLFKLNESKSLRSIEALESHVANADDRIERLDEANRECIQDRVRLQTRCEIFEKRLSQLENSTCSVHSCEIRKIYPRITGDSE
jgi:hypothetical protein